MSKYFAILTYVESFYYIKLRFPEEAGVRKKKKKREGHRNVSEHEQHFYFHFKGSFWSEKLEAYFSLNE